MHTLRGLALVCLALAVTGCKKKDNAAPAAGSGAVAVAGSGSGVVAVAGSGSGAAPAATADPAPLTTGLATPESVLYDSAADRYLIANINGAPTDADDNGYISVVAPDGTVTNAKWIDGAAPDLTLNAPKGMAISGGVLWVADLTVVHKFDPTSGKLLGDVPIAGAVFLNDVAATADGGVVVSDTAFNAKFEPTGDDAIYRISKDGQVATVIKDKGLGAPNGVWVGADGTLWVVTFGTGEVYAIDATGAKQPGHKLPKGQLDGVVMLDGGDLLVSSWEGSAIYRGKPGGEWRAVVEDVKAPADLGWDSKRGRVLIPLFMDNAARFVTLK